MVERRKCQGRKVNLPLPVVRGRYSGPARTAELLSPVSRKWAAENERCIMLQSRFTPAGERIIKPMIELAYCSKLNGIIVAGADSAGLMSALHRRGYLRVVTRANCGLRLDSTMWHWSIGGNSRSKPSIRPSIGWWIF